VGTQETGKGEAQQGMIHRETGMAILSSIQAGAEQIRRHDPEHIFIPS
jgi:hypothetical protein